RRGRRGVRAGHRHGSPLRVARLDSRCRGQAPGVLERPGWWAASVFRASQCAASHGGVGVSEQAVAKRGDGLTVKLVAEMTGYAPAEIALVSRTVAIGAPLQELAVFLHSCRSLGLDPLLRQAYWIRRGNPPKGALQVGIDGFRAIAERSGTYAGAEAIEYRGRIDWVYKGTTLVVPELARAIVWKVVAGHKSAF